MKAETLYPNVSDGRKTASDKGGPTSCPCSQCIAGFQARPVYNGGVHKRRRGVDLLGHTYHHVTGISTILTPTTILQVVNTMLAPNTRLQASAPFSHQKNYRSEPEEFSKRIFFLNIEVTVTINLYLQRSIMGLHVSQCTSVKSVNHLLNNLGIYIYFLNSDFSWSLSLV